MAVGLWYLRLDLGPWPLLLAALGLALCTLTTRKLPVLTAFDPALFLFVAAAGLSVWVAFDKAVAWPKFWAIVSSWVLFRAVLLLPEPLPLGRNLRIWPLRLGFALFPAVIALYFLFTNDWEAWMGNKVTWMDPIRAWLAGWRLPLPGHVMHPNVVGGFLAALLPLQTTALATLPRGWRWLAAAPLMALSLATLIFTVSRGAWIGLAAVAGLWLLWRADRRWLAHLPGRRRWGVWAGLALLALLLTLAAALVVGCGYACQAAVAGRLGLWRASWDLAWDTPFTGLGFGGYEMALSSYTLMLHVGFVFHSHSFYLQVWLEQGLLALLALAALAITALRLTRLRAPWHAAALASFGVMMIHGLFDIPFYGGRGIQLLFVPLALLARSGQPLASASSSPWLRRAAAGGLLLALLLLLLPAPRAAFRANLGAIAQMQTELARYSWPEWPIQDALRREVDLTPAMQQYRAALALQPGNASANRRLGQIELSLGEYEAAHEHLLAAYAAAPGRQAARHLLGESYAIRGEVEQAAALWRTVGARFWWDTDWAGMQAFRLRQWWYEHLGERERAAFVAQAIAALGR